jgi:hypothetical protein
MAEAGFFLFSASCVSIALHPMCFAPAQQLVPTKTRIAAQDDPHLRPGLPDLRHNPFHLRRAAFGPVDIGRPQAGRPFIMRRLGGNVLVLSAARAPISAQPVSGRNQVVTQTTLPKTLEGKYTWSSLRPSLQARWFIPLEMRIISAKKGGTAGAQHLEERRLERAYVPFRGNREVH